MPAAAVIPAPITYIEVVAVKKLVVGFLLKRAALPTRDGLPRLCLSGNGVGPSLGFLLVPGFYFEEIRVFQAGIAGIH